MELRRKLCGVTKLDHAQAMARQCCGYGQHVCCAGKAQHASCHRMFILSIKCCPRSSNFNVDVDNLCLWHGLALLTAAPIADAAQTAINSTTVEVGFCVANVTTDSLVHDSCTSTDHRARSVHTTSPSVHCSCQRVLQRCRLRSAVRSRPKPRARETLNASCFKSGVKSSQSSLDSE